MEIYSGISPHYLYRQQLDDLLKEGQEVTVRGKKTLELLNVVTEIQQPQQRLHMVPGRYANPWLALSESIWMLAGRNDVAALAPYNKRIQEFSDDGVTLYGAYGLRIKDQIPGLIERLKTDSNDRRAVLSIWRPEDLIVDTKDPSCNNIIYFKLRDNRLYMTVICRSNDIHWGLYGVNLCQFSILQEYIAARLKVEMGMQTHFSNSLHVYTEGPGVVITERMLEHWQKLLPKLPESNKLFPTGLMRHKEFVADCNALLGHEYLDESSSFLEFACDFLRLYAENSWRLITEKELLGCRHADYYRDWIEAGEEFLSKN